MRTASRKQTSVAGDGPWLTVEQLAHRWARNPKTIQNGITSGKIPLRPVRLYVGADPLLHRNEVEQYEAKVLQAAGVDPTEPLHDAHVTAYEAHTASPRTGRRAKGAK